MAYEHKAGSFSLFKNDKGDNEKRPDYRGNGKDMLGRDIEVAGWLRDGKEGAPKWLSCTIKLKEPKPAQEPQRTAEPEPLGAGATKPNPFDDLHDPPF